MSRCGHLRAGTILMAILLSCTDTTAQTVINHLNWDPSDVQISTLNKVRTKKIIFIHASVGSNIVNGLMGLRDRQPDRYGLTINHAPVTPNELKGSAFGHEHFTKLPGYEQGTDDKTSPKTQSFDSLMCGQDEQGIEWGDAVDIAFFKFCWVDIRRYDHIVAKDIFNQYISMLRRLEAVYPSCMFVLFTCPIKGNMDSDFEKLDNIKRHEYNQLVRAYADTAGGYLFDIADIEAYDKDGNLQTFEHNSQHYPKMWYVAENPGEDGWSSDGGHLNPRGQEHVALALWRLWSAMVDQLVPTGVGLPEDESAAIGPSHDFMLYQNYPNPSNPSTNITYYLSTSSHVALVIHNLAGQEVCRLVDAFQSAGDHRVFWSGVDSSGRKVASGIYWYKIDTGHGIGYKKMALLK